MAHCIHIVLQVAFSIVWQNDATQLAVTSKVKASISGEHQQTSHIPPTNLLLNIGEVKQVNNGEVKQINNGEVKQRRLLS